MGLVCFLFDSISCCFTFPDASRASYQGYYHIASSTNSSTTSTYNAIPEAWTRSSISDSTQSTLSCPSNLTKQFVYALNDSGQSLPCMSTGRGDYIPSNSSSTPSYINPITNHVNITTNHYHLSSLSTPPIITKAVEHGKQEKIITATTKINDLFSKASGDPLSRSTKPTTNRKKKKKPALCLSTKSRCISGTTVLYTRKTLPFQLKKYYFQRYSYFSKYDEGIMMDKEGWFSVTPEKIARHIAQRCTSNVIIDAFCGCGGNTIQFAFTCQQAHLSPFFMMASIPFAHALVIAIDIDPVKLYCARNNAKIYGVEHKIDFILGDFFELAPHLKADVVFLSPPWGGPSYSKESNYDLAAMMPGNGVQIHAIASRITPNVAFYVPKSTDPLQLIHLGPCEIERNSIQGHPKALTAYYGNLCQPNISASPTQCLVIKDENEY